MISSSAPHATVWAATWVPDASPIEGFGSDGYAVAWVDVADGPRLQVLVNGDAAPPPGTQGVLEHRTAEQGAFDIFVADEVGER